MKIGFMKLAENLAKMVTHALHQDSVRKLAYDPQTDYRDMWRICAMLLSEIKDQSILNVETYRKHAEAIRVPYFTMDAYITELQHIRNLLVAQERIDHNLNTFVQTVTLSEFMQTADGRYMTFTDMLLLLKFGREICELMEHLSTEDTGIVGWNNRVLIPFFMRFRDTLMDLYELQFTKR